MLIDTEKMKMNKKLLDYFQPEIIKKRKRELIVCGDCTIILFSIALCIDENLTGLGIDLKELTLFLLFGIASLVSFVITLKKSVKLYDGVERPNKSYIKKLLRADGIQTVYDDFAHAEKYATASVGNKYLFLKGKALLRLSEIEKTEVRINKNTEEYHFLIHLNNEYATVDISTDSHERTMSYERLCDIIEERKAS